LPSSGRHIAWSFEGSREEGDVLTRGSYTTSGDALAGVTLARAGAGLFQTYRFVVAEDLREGRLVEVLREAGGRTRPFILLYPHARYLTSRVRAFVDFLMEALVEPPVHQA
jgi:DNA-binding transcriptional LysR family regulator